MVSSITEKLQRKRRLYKILYPIMIVLYAIAIALIYFSEGLFFLVLFVPALVINILVIGLFFEINSLEKIETNIRIAEAIKKIKQLGGDWPEDNPKD
jgi:hypothetical protein